MNRTVVSLALTALALTPALAHAQVATQYAVSGFGTLTGASYYQGVAINNTGDWTGVAKMGLGTNALYGNSNSVRILSMLNILGLQGSSINDKGTIAGTVTLTNYGLNGFVQSNGVMTQLNGLLKTTFSSATSVNNLDNVTGYYSTLKGYRAFVLRNGVVTTIGTLGGGGSNGMHINDNNDVVGYSQATDNSPKAFLYTSGGVMKNLGTLIPYNRGASYAFSSNTSGNVVGYSQAVSGITIYTHAFLYTGGVMKDLGTLGGANSWAWSINSNNVVVGEAQPLGSATHYAFIWANGKMQDLNKLIPAGSGWVLTSARGISDTGKIVGYGTYAGQQRAFVLTVAVP